MDVNVTSVPSFAPSSAPTLTTTGNNLTTSNDSEIIRGTLRIYGSIYLAIFLLFCVVRQKYPKLYNLRGWVPEMKSSLAETQTYGFFNWAWRVFQVNDDELVANCGMDAICFLRCLRLGAKLSAIGCLNAIWLIPVYFTAHGLSSTDEDKFVLISVANLQPGSPRFAAVVVAAYITVGSTLYLLSHEYDWYTKLRHKYLSQPIPSNYAVYVSGIPEALRYDFALEAFFQNSLQANVYMNIPKLEAKVARRKVVVQRLEHVMAEQRQTGIVKKHRKIRLRNARKNLTKVAEQVESVQAYKNELQALNREISSRIREVRNSNHRMRMFFTKGKADSDLLRGRILTPADDEVLDEMDASSIQSTNEDSFNNLQSSANEDLPDLCAVDSSFHRTTSLVDPNVGGLNRMPFRMEEESAIPEDTEAVAEESNGDIGSDLHCLPPMRKFSDHIIPIQFGNSANDDDQYSGCDICLKESSWRRNKIGDDNRCSAAETSGECEKLANETHSSAQHGQLAGLENELLQPKIARVRHSSTDCVLDENRAERQASSEESNIHIPTKCEDEDNMACFDEENVDTSVVGSQPPSIKQQRRSSLDLCDENIPVDEGSSCFSERREDGSQKHYPKTRTLLKHTSISEDVELDTHSDKEKPNENVDFSAPHFRMQHEHRLELPLRNHSLIRGLTNNRSGKNTSGSTISKSRSTISNNSFSSMASYLKKRSESSVRQVNYIRGTVMNSVNIDAVTGGVKNVFDFGVNGAFAAASEAKKAASIGISTIQKTPDKAMSSLAHNASFFTPVLLNKGEGAPCDAGFVVFKDLYSTAAALQMLQHPVATSFMVENAPGPQDVFWSNVGVPYSGRRTGTLISLVCTGTLCVFWSIPVAFINSLTSVNSLKESIPRLADAVEAVPALDIFLPLIAPLLLLMLNEALLPVILKGFSKWEGHISAPKLDASVFRKLSVFAIVQTFFVSTVSGSFTSQLTNMLDQPGNIVSFLANSLPTQASYFIQIVLIFTFLVQGIELLRIPALAYAFIRRFFGPNLTTKERKRKWKFIYSLQDPPPFYHAEVFSQIVLFYVVFLVYAPISPITCVFLLGCFVILESGYRYHLIHNYPVYQDSGGRIWKGFVMVLMWSILIGQLTLIGLLLLNQAFYSVPALSPLLAFTILFMILVHPKQIRASNFLPVIQCLEVDETNLYGSINFAFLRDQYLQPALKTQSLEPDECSDS